MYIIINVKNMKVLWFALLAHIFSVTDAFCQNFSGYLSDPDHNPIEYANIILLLKSDSTLIRGTVSDPNGYFSLPVSHPEKCIIKISSILYKTVYVDNLTNLCDTFQLVPSTQSLDEVVIKGRKKILKKENGKIIASIENSPLSFSGNANDVLTRLPLVVENNGDIQVLGKGTPLIYINNRRIEDNNELVRLKSHEIKKVEIITTPGVEYNSSANSVIKIYTVPLQGEGFSGNFQVYGALSKRMSEYLNATIKYRHRGFDLFVEGDILNYRGDYIRNTAYISSNSNLYHGDVNIERLKGYIGGGINYTPNEQHSLGIKYNLTNTPKDNENKNSIVTENSTYSYDSFGLTEADSHKNYLNLYYTGQLSTIDVDFNADYSSGKETGNSLVKEYKEEEDIVRFGYGDNYDLFASKILLKYPFKKHVILLGGEYSFTNRKSFQDIFSDSNISDITSSSNRNKQQLGAIFANYDIKLNRFYVSIGARYEYTVFNYFEDNIKIDEQSKKYHEFIPNLAFGYEGENWQGELSFRKYVDRPPYNKLSNKISYVANFARWSGNPFLRPSIDAELGLQFSWNNLMVMATLDRISKQIIEVNKGYQHKPDIILVIPENLPSYNFASVDVSYNIQVGIWQPSVDVCVQFQDLKYGKPLTTYNKTIAEFLQRHYFGFKNNFSLLFTLGYRTRGNYATAYTQGYTNLGLTIAKSFLSKALLFKLDCKDILNKSREKMSMTTNGLSMIDTSKGNTRIFKFSITYYFNKSSNRYKGKGAAWKEIKRL